MNTKPKPAGMGFAFHTLPPNGGRKKGRPLVIVFGVVEWRARAVFIIPVAATATVTFHAYLFFCFVLLLCLIKQLQQRLPACSNMGCFVVRVAYFQAHCSGAAWL